MIDQMKEIFERIQKALEIFPKDAYWLEDEDTVNDRLVIMHLRTMDTIITMHEMLYVQAKIRMEFADFDLERFLLAIHYYDNILNGCCMTDVFAIGGGKLTKGFSDHRNIVCADIHKTLYQLRSSSLIMVILSKEYGTGDIVSSGEIVTSPDRVEIPIIDIDLMPSNLSYTRLIDVGKGYLDYDPIWEIEDPYPCLVLTDKKNQMKTICYEEE